MIRPSFAPAPAILALGIALAGILPVEARAGTSRDPADARHRDQRLRMVELIRKHGVRDSATLRALRIVPRHEFVPREEVGRAYGDHPLPIGYGQTISQPYIVGYMTEILKPKPGMQILEVGTGSGYQAAVLAEIGCDVHTIEIIKALARSAGERLRHLDYARVHLRHGDGFDGWTDAAPFDRIIVTAAAGYIPPPLLDQLKPDGRMVIPVGSVYGIQDLILVEKDPRGAIRTTHLLPVRFVPLVRGSR
jgi:protein-L-isoaspartate(D-aspartate) O-methyltransferase